VQRTETADEAGCQWSRSGARKLLSGWQNLLGSSALCGLPLSREACPPRPSGVWSRRCSPRHVTRGYWIWSTRQEQRPECGTGRNNGRRMSSEYRESKGLVYPYSHVQEEIYSRRSERLNGM